MANMNNDGEDGFLLLLIGAGILMLTPFSLTLAPVRAWAIANSVLVTGDAVLVPIWDGAGLDIWRIAIAAGIVIAAIAMIVAGIRAKQKGARRV